MKSRYYFLAASLLLSSLQGWAADQPIASSPAMGRLFFTPTERASLDIVRQNSKAPDKLIKANESDKEELSIDTEAEPLKRVIVKGYVGRSDGKNTIWVNDKPMAEYSSSKDITIGKLQKNSGQVQVTVNGAEKKSIALKAGQIYDPNSNKIYNHLKDIPSSSENEEPKTILDNISENLNTEKIKEKIGNFFSNLTGQNSPAEQTP